MSFGFSGGDFLAVGRLCWTVYKKCKDSPGTYAELTGEVNNLRAVMFETEELVSAQQLSVKQQEKLAGCQKGCEQVLKDLDTLLAKYDSLGTQSRRVFDRMRLGNEDVNGIRKRLILNVTLLDAFNNIYSHAKLERKLGLLASEVRAGKREGSIISSHSFAVAAEEDQDTWDALRRDLEDIGVSPDVIKEQRTFILDWFRDALANGLLTEGPYPDADDSLQNISNAIVTAPPGVEDDSLRSTSTCEPDYTSGSYIRNNEAFWRPEKNVEKSTFRLSYRPQLRSVELLEAAKIGEDRQIFNLHEKGVDINMSGELGETALHVAAAYAIIEAKDIKGYTPMHYACFYSDIGAVWLLLEMGAKIESENSMGQTPLHIACKEDNHKVISLLLRKGANIEAKDTGGRTALHFACERANKEVISLLLRNGARTEAKDSAGRTAMFAACDSADTEAVSILIEKGARTEAKDSAGRTVLHFACERANKEVISLLLRNGARTEAKDSAGRTAMFAACDSADTEAVSILIEKGAQIDAQATLDGNTPLLMACGWAHGSEVVSLLLTHGARLEARNKQGETPLRRACSASRPKKISTLLQQGADIEAKDNAGNTPLLAACSNTHSSAVSLLLSKGANIIARNMAGESTLQLARRSGNAEIINRLQLAWGASIQT